MHNLLPYVILSGSLICLLTLLNTNFGLTVLLFSMLLSPEFRVGAIPGRPVVVRIDDILLIVVFLTWLAKMAINNQLGILRRTPLNKPIAVYMVIQIFATLWGIMGNHVSVLRGFFYLLKYFEYYMLFFLVVNNISSKIQVKRLVMVMFIVAVITSVYGIASVGRFGRATAPFEASSDVVGGEGEPNTLGGYAVFIIAIMLGLFLYSRNIAWSAGLLGMISAAVLALMHTLSRGSYLAFLVVIFVLIMLSQKKRSLLIGALLVFIMFQGIILPKKVTARVSETFSYGKVYEPLRGAKITLDLSASARVEAWKDTFERFLMNPVLGYGVTGAGFIDTQIPLVLSETGLLGLAGYLWIMVVIFREGMRNFKNALDPYFRGLLLGYIAGFIGLHIHAFSAATFIIVRIMEPFWFLTAIVIMVPYLEQEESSLAPVPSLDR